MSSYRADFVDLTDQWTSSHPCTGGCGNAGEYAASLPGSPWKLTDVRTGRAGRDITAVLDAHFEAWCFTCRPRRGRRPEGGGGRTTTQAARYEIDRWLAGRRCAVDSTHPATTAMAAPGEPSLAQLRRGVASYRRADVLASATPMCEACLRRTTGAMGRVASSRAAAERRDLTPARVRQAIEAGGLNGPARSENEVLRALGYTEHGNGTRQFIRRLVAAERELDATFPVLPNAVARLNDVRVLLAH